MGEIYTSIRDVEPEEWDRVVGGESCIRMHGYLQALEQVRIADIDRRYLLWRDEEGSLVAHTYIYAVTLPAEILLPRDHRLVDLFRSVRRFWPGFLTVRLIGCGSPTTLGHTLSFASTLGEPGRRELLRQLAAEMLAFARERGATGLVVRDFHREDAGLCAALEQEGFARFPNLEDTLIEIRWASFEEYLRSLKGRYRRLIQEQMELLEKAGIRKERTTEWTHLAEPMSRMFERTASRYTAGPLVGADYFVQASGCLGDRLGATLFWSGERLVGFILYFVDGTALVPSYLGVDYEVNARAALIFNAYFEMVRVAIELRKQRIWFGRTAYETKLRLGAEIVPMDMLIRLHSGLLTRAVARLLAPRVPRQKWTRWSVFRRGDAPSDNPSHWRTDDDRVSSR